MKINSAYVKMETGDAVKFRISDFDGAPAMDIGQYGGDLTVWMTWEALADMRDKLDALLVKRPEGEIKIPLRPAAVDHDMQVPIGTSVLGGYRRE